MAKSFAALAKGVTNEAQTFPAHPSRKGARRDVRFPKGTGKEARKESRKKLRKHLPPKGKGKVSPPTAAKVAKKTRPTPHEETWTWSGGGKRGLPKRPQSLRPSANLTTRTVATGALIIEVPGAENGAKVNVLVERMREVLKEREGIRINRPTKTTEIRI